MAAEQEARAVFCNSSVMLSKRDERAALTVIAMEIKGQGL